MRVFISDTFWEAMFALPRKIQDKLIAFNKKIRECSESKGLHLEPIAQFKNSALRTARLDDNYRVVVGMTKGD